MRLKNDRLIRSYLTACGAHEVKIFRSTGEVHVYGLMPHSTKFGWHRIGTEQEILSEIELEKFTVTSKLHYVDRRVDRQLDKRLQRAS